MEYESGLLIDALDAVKDVAKATKIREYLPFVMLANNQIIAYSGECYVAVDFEHGIEDEIILPFDKLYDLLSSFPRKSMIGIELGEEKVDIKFQRGRKSSKTKIAAIKEKPRVEYLDPPLDDWETLPEDFILGLKKCKFSLPKESLNPALTHFCIRDNLIFTSDDFRISKYKLKENFRKTFNLSGFNGSMIIANSFDGYILRENWIDLGREGIFARMMLGTFDYPDISEEFFEYEENFTVNRSIITTAVDRSILFAEGMSEIDYVATLSLAKNIFTVKSQNDFGRSEEKGNLRKSDIDLDLSINPVYFSQAIKNLSSKMIEVGIGENNRLIFNEDKFSHILATYQK